MTTIISVYNSHGLVGRCDARCHNAKEPECDCVCGGSFHGTRLQMMPIDIPDLVNLARAWAAKHLDEVRDVEIEIQALFPFVTEESHG